MAPFLLAMRMTKITRLIPALALTLCLTGMAHAEGVRILGRYMASPTGGFTVQWPASGFEATFTGAQLVATIEDWGSNWFNIEIDGAVTTLDLQPGVNTYTLFSGPAGPHIIKVTRRTGAQVGPTRFVAIRTKSGSLTPTEAPDRKMLVIGDSITSGYGVECVERTLAYAHATQNADLAYPTLTAKAFGADLQSISIDGRGLTRNYAGDDDTMQLSAWRTLPDISSPWPVSGWQPQAIVINLGVNDFGAGDPGEAFDIAYVDMLRKLRSSYPSAQIIATTGAMPDAVHAVAIKASVQGAVEAVNDPKTSFLEFRVTNTPQRYGCDWHPGRDAHGQMTQTLQATLAQLLGWKPVTTRTPGLD
jgi:lysophospholipase L1-like esterase